MNHVLISLFVLFFSCGVARAQTSGTSSSPSSAPEPTRSWGPTTNGVHVNLSVNKLTYAVGEDVPLHIGLENVSATQPIYEEPFRPHGGFFDRNQPTSVSIAVLDADGPLTSESLLRIGGGPLLCPSPLSQGKPDFLEDSLRQRGLLPRKPGTYKITITWSPYTADVPTCDSNLLHAPQAKTPPPKPIFSIVSNPVYIEIETGPDSPKEPEFTAWENYFSLVDTSFGDKTALLDRATQLEWLRLRFTAGLTLTQIRAQTSGDGKFANWRVATSEELHRFFADFAGDFEGKSANPLIARKLQRLLGGPLETFSDPKTGWYRNSSFGFVGDPTVPEGDLLHYKGGYILEDSDIRVGTRIDLDSGKYTTPDHSDPSWGTFLVRGE